MKTKILLFSLFFIGLNSTAQSIIFQDSFEDYTNFAVNNIGNWTLTDVDQGTAYGIIDVTFPNSDIPKSFQVFNPAFTTPPFVSNVGASFVAKTGTQSMACFNKEVPAPAQNNDWLISPQMVLGTSNTATFWAKASDGILYYAEKFNVYVSNSTTDISSFVKISTGSFIAMPASGATWLEFSFPIPTSFNNVPVYVAIQCVSDNQFCLLIDDFKVTGTVGCPSPQNGTSVVNRVALNAQLSWNSIGISNSEIKIQPSGTGIPSILDNTGTNAINNTFLTSGLLIDTDYEFWVRNECTNSLLFSVWSGPFLFNTRLAPSCVILNSPINGAIAINPVNPVDLIWNLPTTGSLPTSFDVFFDTNPNPTTLLGNVASSPYTITTVAPLTTYYWKIVAKNNIGTSVGCTAIFSFTTTSNAFSPYCGPVTFALSLEPITAVDFAGINKTYSNNVFFGAGIPKHKSFTDVATLIPNQTFNISLKGNTNGDFKNYYTVFIDWNNNGILNDSGEVFFGTNPLTITNSDGLDAVVVTGNIAVPAGATIGSTRMRIKKVFGIPDIVPPGQDNPCISTTVTGQFGEVHDYVVNIINTLQNDTFSSINFKYFPNPVKDILNLTCDKNITNVSVINLLGQEVLTIKNSTIDAKIDMSGLNAGVYIVKISSENEVKTIKVIKE